VSGGLTLGMTKGNGARAISGPKKRQPNRSFSIKQSCKLICIGRKNDVGCPTPANRKPASSIKKNKSGVSTIAASRNIHRRVPDMGAAGAFGDLADEAERLEEDGFISEVASLNLPPRGRLGLLSDAERISENGEIEKQIASQRVSLGSS
jgi:hypothetical protein